MDMRLFFLLSVTRLSFLRVFPRCTIDNRNNMKNNTYQSKSQMGWWIPLPVKNNNKKKSIVRKTKAEIFMENNKINITFVYWRKKERNRKKEKNWESSSSSSDRISTIKTNLKTPDLPWQLPATSPTSNVCCCRHKCANEAQRWVCEIYAGTAVHCRSSCVTNQKKKPERKKESVLKLRQREMENVLQVKKLWHSQLCLRKKKSVNTLIIKNALFFLCACVCVCVFFPTMSLK
jgi:hypothetical protein